LKLLMKQSKQMNLKSMAINKLICVIIALVSSTFIMAQETTETSEVTVDNTPLDTLVPSKKVKIDGVAAVIGDYVILNSDVEKTLIDLRSQGASTQDITQCQLLGKLMEDRLYAHQAVQDSLLVSDDQVNVFGAELEISQIVKSPTASEEEKQKVINRLQTIKQDVEENGASFNVKAILYSQDPGSKSKGGFYSMTRETPFVKEFKDVAFSLQEGQISDPFESPFGYHIIYIEKIRGQERDLRHILLIPEIPQSAVDAAVKELDSIRQQVLDGKYTFAEAARNFSDEKETKYDGGILRNPLDFGSRFELTKMDPALYNQVRDLKDGEISRPVKEDDPRGGAPKIKIMMISNRYDEHTADFAKDYLKIQDLALREKQFRAIKKWMDKHIEDTYVQVNPENKECDFANNWVKE